MLGLPQLLAVVGEFDVGEVGARGGYEVEELDGRAEPDGATYWGVPAESRNIARRPGNCTPRRSHVLHARLIRPIYARYRDGLSLRVSEKILVRRLESRSRQCRGGPSGRDRRKISIAC